MVFVGQFVRDLGHSLMSYQCRMYLWTAFTEVLSLPLLITTAAHFVNTSVYASFCFNQYLL